MSLESENEGKQNRTLKQAWQLGEKITDVWSRFCTLTSVLNSIPPESCELKKYCIDNLFALYDSMNESDKEKALLMLIWKLSPVDQESALKAFDLLVLSELETKNETALSFAAEALAGFAPERAMQIADLLANYSLIHKALTKIAEGYAKQGAHDLAGKAMESAHRQILQSNRNDGSAHEALEELAKCAAGFADKARVKAIIKDAHRECLKLPQLFLKQLSLVYLAETALKLAPELNPAIMKDAISNAIKLRKHEPEGWFDMGGGKLAAIGLAEAARVLSKTNKADAVSLLATALEFGKDEGDAYEQLPALTSIAKSACVLSESENEELANDLWISLRQLLLKGGNGKNAFYIFRDLNRDFDSFALMNIPAASRQAADFIRELETVAPSEQIVRWTCRIAEIVGKTEPETGKKLIASAREKAYSCTSDMLKSAALARVASAMSKLDLDSAACTQELLEYSKKADSAAASYKLLIELAQILSDSEPELAHELVAKAKELAGQLQVNSLEPINELEEKPPVLFSDLSLYWIERLKEMGLSRLSRWADFYGKAAKKIAAKKQ